jgi:hypothetical protein
LAAPPATETTPGIGDNMPPEPLAQGSEVELATALSGQNLDLTARVAEIERAVDDPARLPDVVTDEEQAGRIAEFVRQCTAEEKKAATRHDDAKRPYLTLGKLVDGFFGGYARRLKEAKAKAQHRLTVYLAEKDRRAREEHAAEQRRHAEAQRQAAEEQRRKAEAAARRPFGAPPLPVPTPVAPAAPVPPPAPVQVRGSYGAVTGLVTKPDFEIEDIAQIPLNKLRPYIPRAAIEQAIRAFMRAGGTELKGVKFVDRVQARTR